MQVPDDKQAAFNMIIAALEGRARVADVEPFMSPDVILHFDSNTSYGYRIWYTWLTFLQVRGRAKDLHAIHTDTRINADDTITAIGYWVGAINGVEQRSDELKVHYRIEEGVIQEIWTERINYVLPLGEVMRHPVLWVLPVVHCTVWKWFAKEANPQFARSTQTT